MKRHLAFFLHLNHTMHTHLIKDLLSNDEYSFPDYLFNHVFNLILKKLKNLKIKTITLFVFDLNKLNDYFIEKKYEDIRFISFSSKNILYSLKCQHLFYPDQRIIFKDCYHFIGENNTIQILQQLANLVWESYSLDIYKHNILSLSSIGMHLFKKISPHKAKRIIKLNETEDNYIRKAYFGGRTEIIEPIATKCYYYDINSLYPFVMKTYPMPVGIPIYTKTINIDDFFGIIDVLVCTPENIYLPILPIRSQNDGLGIIYPKGCFRGIYFSEELKLALKYGYQIITIFDGYAFQKEIIFDDFVNELYQLRILEKDIKMKTIIKLIMNSLYGRYGALYEEEIIVDKNHDIEAVKKKFENVAISGAIAAYARMHMYNFVIQNNVHLIYWDTDSIIIKEPITIIPNHELGEFRLVANINKLICLSSKFYLYESDQTFTYVFRGLNVQNYVLIGKDLFNYFIKELYKPSTNPIIKEITLFLQQKDHTIVEYLFQFHNKRHFLIKENNIITQPWTIQPKGIKK